MMYGVCVVVCVLCAPSHARVCAVAEAVFVLTDKLLLCNFRPLMMVVMDMRKNQACYHYHLGIRSARSMLLVESHIIFHTHSKEWLAHIEFDVFLVSKRAKIGYDARSRALIRWAIASSASLLCKQHNKKKTIIIINKSPVL